MAATSRRNGWFGKKIMNGARRRIWVLDGSVAVTGAFISAREISRALREEADVILVLPDTTRIQDAELSDFAAVHRLPIRPLRRGLGHAALYLPYLLLASFRLRRLLARDGAQVLLLNDFHLMQGPVLRLLGYRGRMLTWVRIDPAAFGLMGRIWLAAAARSSQRVLAVSQHIQRLLPLSVPSNLLYDALSAEFLSTPAPRGPQGYEFVFIGNYIEGKGQDIAIDALAELLKSFPTARLRFHGDDMGLPKNRAYRHALECQAEKLGVTDAVVFTSFVRSPRQSLEGAFAALNLSRSESFSRTVLEASACGLPVIATRSGGPEEIVEDGCTGLMIPVGDAKACAAAMRTLCRDPSLAARMGQAGRQRVMKIFAPDAFAARLRAVLQE
jgi:glycosyltransferase involved in cell wall biosynthesis